MVRSPFLIIILGHPEKAKAKRLGERRKGEEMVDNYFFSLTYSPMLKGVTPSTSL